MLLEMRHVQSWPAWENPTAIGVYPTEGRPPIDPSLREQMEALNFFREQWTHNLINCGLGLLAWYKIEASHQRGSLIDGSGRVRLQPVRGGDTGLGYETAAIAFWTDSDPERPIFESISSRLPSGEIKPMSPEYMPAAESVFDMLDAVKAYMGKRRWPDVDPRSFQIPISRYILTESERQELVELELACRNYIYVPTDSL